MQNQNPAAFNSNIIVILANTDHFPVGLMPPSDVQNGIREGAILGTKKSIERLAIADTIRDSILGGALGAGIGAAFAGGARGASVGAASSLMADLSVSKDDGAHLYDIAPLLSGIAPASFWTSMNPSYGLRVRLISVPTGAAILQQGEATGYNTDAEFYASPATLATSALLLQGYEDLPIPNCQRTSTSSSGVSSAFVISCKLIRSSRRRRGATRRDSPL